MSFAVTLSYVSIDPAIAAAVVSAVGAAVSAYAAVIALRRQSTPDVIAYVGPSPEFPDFAALYIRNVGDAPAFDVKTNIKGEMPDAFATWGGGASGSFIETGVPMLAPDAVRGVMVAPFGALMDETPEAALDVSWARRPGGRLRMSGLYPIEFRSFGGLLTGGGEYSYDLRRISESLDRIAAAERSREFVNKLFRR